MTTVINSNRAAQAAYSVARKIISFLQANLRLNPQWAKKPLEGMSNKELEALVIEHFPELTQQPSPPVIGPTGIADAPDGESAVLTITLESVKACVAPNKPIRTSGIASLLGVTRADVERIIAQPGSGLKKTSGGWVQNV